MFGTLLEITNEQSMVAAYSIPASILAASGVLGYALKRIWREYVDLKERDIKAMNSLRDEIAPLIQAVQEQVAASKSQTEKVSTLLLGVEQLVECMNVANGKARR